MTAVATKPRKGAPKQPGVPAPAVYQRPESTYRPAIGNTAEERLAILRATLRMADEKLEAAYDAAERGTVVDTLLHLVAHDLLCDVMRPELMGEEGAPYPNRTDLDEAYIALFPVLASLEGAMALSMGTVVHSTIADAYNLLDWAQDECNSAALGKLLPGFDPDATFNRGRDLAIELLKEGQRQYTLDTASAQRTYRPADALGGAVKQNNFVQQYLHKIEEDSTLGFGFSSVLSAALSEQPTDDPEAYRVPLAEFQAGKPGDDGTEPVEADDARDAGSDAALNRRKKDVTHPEVDESDPRTRIAEALAVLFAAAREHASAEVWGVHSLANLIERTLGSANPEDADDLHEVSNLLEQVLAVIEKVNDEALDCMLLHAGASLLTTAKQLVDDKCEAVS